MRLLVSREKNTFRRGDHHTPSLSSLLLTCRASLSSRRIVSQVGLPDDELYRRVRHHRGVYGKWEDTSPGDYTLFHICPAQFFHKQLPIGTGMHGQGRGLGAHFPPHSFAAVKTHPVDDSTSASMAHVPPT
jgi:hypothetical protein